MGKTEQGKNAKDLEMRTYWNQQPFGMKNQNHPSQMASHLQVFFDSFLPLFFDAGT